MEPEERLQRAAELDVPDTTMADEPGVPGNAAAEPSAREAPASASVGHVKKLLGWVTGDRRVEAKGRAEQNAAGRGETASDVDVDEAEKTVRQDHGDVST